MSESGISREARVHIGGGQYEGPTDSGGFTGKVQAIEWRDSRLTAPLLERLESAGLDHRVLLLSDHKTLTATRGHGGGPAAERKCPGGSGTLRHLRRQYQGKRKCTGHLFLQQRGAGFCPLRRGTHPAVPI